MEIKAKCTSINAMKWDKNTEYSYSFQAGTDKSKNRIYVSFSEFNDKNKSIYEIDKEYTISIK